MACFERQSVRVGQRHVASQMMVQNMLQGQKPQLLDTAKRTTVPVISAPCAQLRKQLAGFPTLYKHLKLNLDLRQYRDVRSCMWSFDEQYPGDHARRWEVLIRWDALSSEWFFDNLRSNCE